MAGSDELRRVFASSLDDQDGDGRVSVAELRVCMTTAAISEDISGEDVRAAVASSADADGDWMLDEEELAMLVMEAACQEEEEEAERCGSRWLREAFAMYEMEGRGCITPLSLKLMLRKLGAHRDIAECQAMICRFDLDGDGVLSFHEFKTMMLTG